MSFDFGVLWVLLPLIAVIVLSLLYLSHGKGIDLERINADYERWKDWASVLLIVMTVLLAFDGSLLGDASNRFWVLLGGVIGFVGVLLVAMWFTREGFWEYTGNYQPFKGKPVLLLYGSSLFGLQTVFFLFAFVFKQLN
jgi:hypothetical protein